MKIGRLQNWVGAFVALILGMLLLLPVAQTFAADVIDPICQNADPNNRPAICKENDAAQGNPLFGPDGILTKAVQIISLVVGIAAVIVIIIAGIRFMTSSGDPQKVSSARNAIIYAAVGVAVASAAQFIVAFVLSKL